MKLHEYQAKKIFEKYGIAVMPGEVAETPEQAKEIAAKLKMPVVIKAQVLVGGRGKAGGVKLANSVDEAYEKAQAILALTIKGIPVKKVLVTEAVDIGKEFYLSLILDRDTRKIAVMVSEAGGIDIEEVAAKTPEKIAKAAVDLSIGLRSFNARAILFKAGFDKAVINDATKILTKLYSIFRHEDASLVEINPLVLTKDGKVIAVDAKIILDENATYRHAEFKDYLQEEEDNELEREAHKRGLPYVKVDGDIGIIGNGAGLVMGTMDLVKLSGGKPANFLDIGGGAKAEVMKSAMEVVLSDKQVKGLLVNIFGGITRCDEVAKGMLEVAKAINIKVPVVVRLAGTRDEEGRALLQGSSFTPATGMLEAAQKIVQLSYAK